MAANHHFGLQTEMCVCAACMRSSTAVDRRADWPQVVDPLTRERIPNTVRWFRTLTHQQHFAAVLGRISLADVAYEPPAGRRQQRSSGGDGAAPGGGAAGKAPKEKKPAKPKQAPKPVANGEPPGARYARLDNPSAAALPQRLYFPRKSPYSRSSGPDRQRVCV